MPYLQIKGAGKGHSYPLVKPDEYKFVTMDQFKELLVAIYADESNLNKVRDWHIIFLGFFLGLRAQECARLTRANFRMLLQNQVMIPTLKQRPKTKSVCKKCGKTMRVSSKNSGKELWCGGCGTAYVVPVIDAPQEAIEKRLPVLEPQVVKAITIYNAQHMRQDQLFLFEPRGSKGNALTPKALNMIFNTYAARIGLPIEYTFHSLRHGRGVQIYSKFKDLKAVQGMLRHKSTNTSQIYASLDPDTLNAYQKKLSEDFSVETPE